MKIKCNYLFMTAGDVVHLLIHPDEAGEFRHDINQYTDKDLLTVEVKKYKPTRTLAQNAFFHKTVGYLAFKLGMDADFVKEGIKQMYGYRMRAYGDAGLIPKPSHLCSIDEMGALIEGCFQEAGEQSIDMRDYILKWEQYKKERLDKKVDV